MSNIIDSRSAASLQCRGRSGVLASPTRNDRSTHGDSRPCTRTTSTASHHGEKSQDLPARKRQTNQETWRVIFNSINVHLRRRHPIEATEAEKHMGKSSVVGCPTKAKAEGEFVHHLRRDVHTEKTGRDKYHISMRRCDTRLIFEHLRASHPGTLQNATS